MTGDFDIPVVLCVYNRPELTRQTLSAIRAVRPKHLLIVADGPNAAKPTDRARCEEVLAVLSDIEWDAKVDTNIAPENLGCRKRIQTGLDWVFDTVGEAIIIEDDCVPDQSFFAFCAELLRRYGSDPQVGVIGGTNFQFGANAGPASYYFSRYPLMWGWATWRRMWDRYDADLAGWAALRDTSWLADILVDPLPTAYWRAIFDRVRSGLDTWDYSMVFSCWREQALSVQPRYNLVRNIGFGANSTHTDDARSLFANMPIGPMTFPLVHPDRAVIDPDRDRQIERLAFSGTLQQRLSAARGMLKRKNRD